ncbi:two-component system, chemotaxis family, sensor kinase CheA [Chryseolinea serpens]|uniref:Chemotaxis protein CheA n=1 Tax=Chryseolinea serpens TaxID=947013 RepID=A0A1M5X228_9BACT|nr:chemotaxis protein CheA [Chryseolinea serpens]SHH93869.1 two-component system, chemotaxis family, sensor kinase CheA [Chryseolinea serpens]
MKNKDDEYEEIFLAEAMDNFEEINRLLTLLERNKNDKNTIHALFRITHTLKGNASGMGFNGIYEIAHVLEDLFGEVRDGRMTLDENLFTSMYKAADVLGNLINSIKDKSEVKYKGIKTKLEVLIKRAKERTTDVQHTETSVNRPLVLESSETGVEDAFRSDEVGPGESDNKISFSDLVQVPVRKLDNLLNLVGELIIEKDRILATQASSGLHASNEYARLSRISSDLQYSVMDVRLVQVGFLFNKFHRVVRDAASVEGKDVVLKLEGTDTEIDRNVLQVISDSLIHLIRNCVGHGIEEPGERVSMKKPKDGVITLSARSETDAVRIEISDDGRGLNYQRIKAKAISKGLITAEDAEKLGNADLSMLIFEPGFSTMDEVTAISGRGVGMDVVKKTLDSIGGTIRLASTEGEGTVIQLTLPSSMAVKSSLLFELKREVYAIPLAYTESVISLYKTDIHKAGGGLVATHLGKNIAIVFLQDVFEQQAEKAGANSKLFQAAFDDTHPETKLEIVVVNFNNRAVGIVVDKLLQQKEIVEKPLMKPVDRIKFISGFTILGSGNVCLVLNVPYLLNFIFSLSAQHKSSKNFNLN